MEGCLLSSSLYLLSCEVEPEALKSFLLGQTKYLLATGCCECLGGGKSVLVLRRETFLSEIYRGIAAIQIQEFGLADAGQ